MTWADMRPHCPIAGRAAEDILYGRDEMSTINQRQLIMARRIAQKLVVSGGLSDAAGLGPSPITHPVPMGDTLGQIVPARVSTSILSVACTGRGRRPHSLAAAALLHIADTPWMSVATHGLMIAVTCLQVTAATQDAADREMAKLLADAYDDVLATLQRNRTALDKAVSVLLEQTTMSGQEVRMICLLSATNRVALDVTTLTMPHASMLISSAASTGQCSAHIVAQAMLLLRRFVSLWRRTVIRATLNGGQQKRQPSYDLAWQHSDD